MIVLGSASMMYQILNELNALTAYGCTCLLSRIGYEECPIHAIEIDDDC